MEGTNTCEPNAKENSFSKELTELLNRHCRENHSDTPDFILAQYLWGCLFAFDMAVNSREQWYGHEKKAIAIDFSESKEKPS